MLGRQFLHIAYLVMIANGAAADGTATQIPSFQGRFVLNWPDTKDNKALQVFLERNEGHLVFLELEIDASVSVDQQVETMKSCRLDTDVIFKDPARLLGQRLGFPETSYDQVVCWNWLLIDSPRNSLPENGASTGLVWYNLDGFFFIRGETHGDGPQSFNLREIDADADTWARATAKSEP